MPKVAPLQFKILIKRDEDGRWTGHCLELDIVTTADSPDEAEGDIVDLIRAQVTYAIENDNMEYLYKDAPPEVWHEYFECAQSNVKRVYIPPEPSKDSRAESVPPVSFFANSCQSPKHCHA